MNEREGAEVRKLVKYSRNALAQYLAISHVLPIDWHGLDLFEQYFRSRRLECAMKRYAQLRKGITPMQKARWKQSLMRKQDLPLLRSLSRTRRQIDRLGKDCHNNAALDRPDGARRTP
jgi:hypothetical protein